MTVLVTGAAGFIGFNVTKALLEKGEDVIGLDALNDYYDVRLKEARLSLLKAHSSFRFVKMDLSERGSVLEFFKKTPQINRVVHLAAQAGVRYSLTHPFAYADANLLGHLGILEGCRLLPEVKHLVYASSSSVYGSNTKLPFSIKDPVEHPISLYAATKRSCELMSDCYAHLFNLPQSGMRYFTVYGPWGRPDMAAFIFTKAILEGSEMPVFNNGNMRRNYTYVQDIVEGTLACLNHPPAGNSLHRIYNIGNNRSENLMHFIEVLEKHLGKKARIRFEPMQLGDVPETIADIEESTRDFGFLPRINIEEGLASFVEWYRSYYGA